jgi:hypothetical protein
LTPDSYSGHEGRDLGPRRVHRAADRAARRLRVPRGRIYVRALEAYLAATSEDEITRRLDAV